MTIRKANELLKAGKLSASEHYGYWHYQQLCIMSRYIGKPYFCGWGLVADLAA
jgi:hypothetical protein